MALSPFTLPRKIAVLPASTRSVLPLLFVTLPKKVAEPLAVITSSDGVLLVTGPKKLLAPLASAMLLLLVNPPVRMVPNPWIAPGLLSALPLLSNAPPDKTIAPALLLRP